jgi:hypothetical protein
MIARGGVLLTPPHLATVRDSEQIQIATEARAGCVPRDTLVACVDGDPRRIQDLRAGDQVMTYDARAHLIDAEAVLDVVVGTAEAFVVVNQRFWLTAEQEVLCDNGFTTAGSLRLGDRLVGGDQRPVAVTTLERRDTEAECFSVTLRSGNAYFASFNTADDNAANAATVVLREAPSVVLREGSYKMAIG